MKNRLSVMYLNGKYYTGAPFFFSLVLFIFLSSCAHNPSYVERLAQRPNPTGEQAVTEECAWIRSEIAHMQAPPPPGVTWQFALIVKTTINDNIAALESRAAELKCGAAFSTTTIIEKNTSPSINECIKACKDNTNRTSEQCFDSCNH